MADGVGFEPTGLSSHLISSQRRYNHFGNHPHLEYHMGFEPMTEVWKTPMLPLHQ